MSPTNQLIESGTLLTGQRGRYRIREPLGRGGRGQTYLATIEELWEKIRGNSPDDRVVVKTVAIDPKRSSHEIRSFCSVVDRKLSHEVVALQRLDNVRRIAHYIDTGIWPAVLDHQTKIYPRFIVQEFIEGQRMDLFLEEEFASDGEFCGIPNFGIWSDFALSIAKILEQVHSFSVVHGDIWQKNIMIRDGQTYLIDFGESIFRTADYPDIDSQLDRNDQFVPPEWNHLGRIPSRRSDVYQLGGVLYYLATGQLPPSPVKDIESLKARVAGDIRHRNEALLDQNIGVADIIARCLRMERTNRTATANALVQEILRFSRRQMPCDIKSLAQEIVDECSLQLGDSPLFHRLLEERLRETLDLLRDCRQGLVIEGGNHDALVEGFLRLLSLLRAGDEYLAISTPHFWTQANMGVNGRFVSMNRLCAQEGVSIRRVFLLTDQDTFDEQFRTILRTHAKMEKDLRDKGHTGLSNFCLRVTEAERQRLIDTRRHRGLLISNGAAYSATPLYGSDGRLSNIKLCHEEASTDHLRREFEIATKAREVLTDSTPEWLWYPSSSADPGVGS